MTHDQLAAFVAVVEHGSFSQAATRLAKSQPALSKLVKNLEEHLGLELLDRSSYRPLPTTQGRLFYERARALLDSTSALESFAAALSGGVESHIRVALECVCPLTPVLEALGHVHRHFPTARIELSKEPMLQPARDVAKGRFDVAVSSDSSTGQRSARNVECVPFGDIRIYPVAHKQHILGGLGRQVPPALLLQHPQIVLSDNEPDAAAINVLEGGIRWRVNDVSAKLEIIRAGLGWGGLPEHVVMPALRAGELVVLDVEDFHIKSIPLYLLRPRKPAPGPAAQALWQQLLKLP
ncbi:MAG: LysR family transcriptional regulator [Polyangiaceae bacterium]